MKIVEQGEYRITDISYPIGTFNVRQCIILYIRKGKVHGLAHVDGHVEIKSLNHFFKDLKIDLIDPTNILSQCESIKILGATSKFISGLDNAEFNKNKLYKFLRNNGLSNPEEYYEQCNLKNFSIKICNGEENVTNIEDTYQSIRIEKIENLYMLQELQRVGGNVATYPIINPDKEILINEKIFYRLKSSSQYDFFQKLRHSQDSDDYSFFNGRILSLLQKLQSLFSKKTLFIEKILPTVINIEESIISPLQSESILNQLYKHNTALILDAIKFCCDADNKLSLDKFIEGIFSEVQHNQVITNKCELLLRSYGGKLNIGRFLEILRENSPKLYISMIINGKGVLIVHKEMENGIYDNGLIYTTIDETKKKLKEAFDKNILTEKDYSMLRNSIVSAEKKYNEELPKQADIRYIIRNEAIDSNNTTLKRIFNCIKNDIDNWFCQNESFEIIEELENIKNFKLDNLSSRSQQFINIKKMKFNDSDKKEYADFFNNLIESIKNHYFITANKFNDIYNNFIGILKELNSELLEQFCTFSDLSISKHFAEEACTLESRGKSLNIDNNESLEDGLMSLIGENT